METQEKYERFLIIEEMLNNPLRKFSFYFIKKYCTAPIIYKFVITGGREMGQLLLKLLGY